MSVLNFDKPAKLKPTQDHQEYYSSDSGVLGTYVPNMSAEDRLKWKAKKIGGEDPRVEIRKTLSGTQILMVVRPDGGMVISANGKMVFTRKELAEFEDAIDEANTLLS